MARVKVWAFDNIIAIALVVVFIPIFILTQNNSSLLESIGSTSIEYLNNEFYRWITCIFYHFNFIHIFFNSLALISIGSLLSPFIGKWRTLMIFILGGALAEAAFSITIHYGEQIYGGGSSGGIFALIAAFLVCYLRFPDSFKLNRLRLDLLAVILYFIFANDNQGSFLTHTFGFAAGILLTTIMVLFNVIKEKPNFN